MELLFKTLLALLTLMMFFVNRKYKYVLFLTCCICFNMVSLPVLGESYLALSICFLISELPNLLIYIKRAKYTNIITLMIMMCIASFAMYVTSPHLLGAGFYHTVFTILNELFTKSFAVFFAFVCISKVRDLRKVMIISIFCMIILTVFGIHNYLFKYNFLQSEFNIILGEKEAGFRYTDSERFRVQSMFKYAFDYGFVCTTMLFFHLYGYIKKIITKKLFLIALGCSLFGIYTCNCRTVILCLFIGIVVFVLCNYDFNKNIKYALIMIPLLILSYSTIPFVHDYFGFAMSVFDKNSEISGSSLELRSTQYFALLDYIQGYELFGRGYTFFYIDLGWSDGYESLKDSRLAGLEGVLMLKMLEGGLFGVITYLTFYISLFMYAYKRRYIDRITSSIMMAILVIYFSYANMTGELFSAFPTLILSGALMGIINRKELSFWVIKKRMLSLKV